MASIVANKSKQRLLKVKYDHTPFLGLKTNKASVIFIDFENPLAVLNTRTQTLEDAEDVYFWRVNNEKMAAPKLDSKDWKQYKDLPEGAVLIFDTLRASQSKDENASNEMGLIMGRQKNSETQVLQLSCYTPHSQKLR